MRVAYFNHILVFKYFARSIFIILNKYLISIICFLYYMLLTTSKSYSLPCLDKCHSSDIYLLAGVVLYKYAKLSWKAALIRSLLTARETNISCVDKYLKCSNCESTVYSDIILRPNSFLINNSFSNKLSSN